ncbi:MAG: tail fiber protein [bacterium]|nr:tail fiber protein [bacterium]
MTPDSFLGSIYAIAGIFAPTNSAFCSGGILPILESERLYSLLGTAYGGDGRASFGLPNLKCRVPIGCGDGPDLPPPVERGSFRGAEDTSVEINPVAYHTHAASFDAASLNAFASTRGTAKFSGTLRCHTTASDNVSPENSFPGAAMNVVENLFATASDGTQTAAIELKDGVVENMPLTTTFFTELVPVAVTQAGTSKSQSCSKTFQTMSPFTVINYVIVIDSERYPPRS